MLKDILHHNMLGILLFNFIFIKRFTLFIYIRDGSSILQQLFLSKWNLCLEVGRPKIILSTSTDDNIQSENSVKK